MSGEWVRWWAGRGGGHCGARHKRRKHTQHKLTSPSWYEAPWPLTYRRMVRATCLGLRMGCAPSKVQHSVKSVSEDRMGAELEAAPTPHPCATCQGIPLPLPVPCCCSLSHPT